MKIIRQGYSAGVGHHYIALEKCVPDSPRISLYGSLRDGEPAGGPLLV